MISWFISVDPLPSFIQLNINSNYNISISWNSTWEEYLIVEYSRNEGWIRNWTTDNTLMTPFNLTNATDIVKMSVCPDRYVNFTISSKLN